jgi:hypothetical protein
VRPFASFPSPELTLMVVEKRCTVELRRDGGWTIWRRRAVRSSLGRWLDAKGRGVDGGRTQSLGAGAGADFAGTMYVAVGESWTRAGAYERASEEQIREADIRVACTHLRESLPPSIHRVSSK